MKFSRRLKKLRMKKHLSQDKLSKKFKISPSTLSQYENEKRIPDLETILKIADYFEVSLDYLVGRTIHNSYDQRSKDIFDILGNEIIELLHDLNDLADKERELLKNQLELIKFKRNKK